MRSHYQGVIQVKQDRTASTITKIEAEKKNLSEQLKSALEDFNEMNKSFDEERKKNTALRHEITMHQKYLQESDIKLKTLSSEKQHLNAMLTQIKGNLTETKRTIHIHEQTIATATNKLQENEKEITKLQGILRVHESQAEQKDDDMLNLSSQKANYRNYKWNMKSLIKLHMRR